MFDNIIIGLGNPGKDYELTRHNAGFLALDELSARYNIKISKHRFQALSGEGVIAGRRVLLIKPQTFMNNSGQSAGAAAEFYKLPPERLIVVYDDMSLPPGKLRVRTKGSDGGHNGIKDIIYRLRSDAFARVKIGIGAPPEPDWDKKDWVLGRFSGAELETMKTAVKTAAGVAAEMVEYGAERAMNDWNGKEG